MSDPTPDTPSRRKQHVDEVRILDHWCSILRRMFPTCVSVLQVGSSLVRDDYRDVDIRIVLWDKDHRRLTKAMEVNDLNMLLSQWGRRMTGMPIDCQVQSMAESAADKEAHPDRPPSSTRGIPSDWWRREHG